MADGVCVPIPPPPPPTCEAGEELVNGVCVTPPPPPPPTWPGAPTGLAATANGPSQIDLAWTAPASTGGSAITGYKIEVSPDGSSWSDLVADTASPDTAYAHMELDPATTRHYRVSAINAVGTSDASDSDDTTTASTNTAPTGAPTITGTAQVGQTLTAATTGITDADGLTSPTYTYQWIRVDGTEADIAAANSSTYILVDADLGTTLKVRVTFADDLGHTETLTSAATAAVSAAGNTLATGAPTITGTACDGRADDHRHGAGRADADGLDHGYCRRQRADHPQLHVPVDPGGRHGRGGHCEREFEHLHPGRRRPGHDPHGAGDLRRRPRPYRDAHQRGDGDGGRGRGSDGPDGDRCGGHVNAGLGHHLLPRGRGHRIHRDVQRPGDGDRHTDVRVQAGRGDAAGRVRARLGQRGVGVRPDGAGRRGRSQRHLVECDRARLDGGTITQTGATTAARLTHAAQASLEGHRVDAAPPMQVSASVQGLALVLVYDEPLDPASLPATGAYTVTATGGATTTTPAVSEVSIYGIWVTLTLDAAPAAGATVTLAYAPPASNPVQDEAGNDAPAFSGQSVRLGAPPRLRSAPGDAQVLGVGVAPGNAQLVVTWTAVDTATGYTVQWKSGGQGYNTGDRQATVTPGSTTSHTIEGLANGTEYTVRVIATRTDANDGPPSAEVTGTTEMIPVPTPTLPEIALLLLAMLLLGSGVYLLRGRQSGGLTHA